MRRAAVLFVITGCWSGFQALAQEPGPAPTAAEGPVLEPWRAAPAPVQAEPARAGAGEARPAEVDLLQVAKPDPVEPVPAEELSLGWTLIRTFVVLGIVVLCAYITLNFGLRRLMGIAAVPRSQGVVQLVERIPLDQKRAMFVIKAAGEYLLIGGGEGTLSLIAKLDPQEVERLQQQRPPSLSLSPLLQKLLKRRDVPAPPAPGDNS